MDLERALEYAAEGEALLFVGSGFSQGALNKRGSTLLKGRELAKLLSSQVEDLPEDTALDDAAEEFVEVHGESKLIELLGSEFSITEVGSHHLNVARCPWRRIYTTNYDNVVELAGVRVGRPTKPITLSDNAYEQDQSKPQCVHLNGYIRLLTEETLWSEFKLLESSYLSASIAESPWSAMFRADVEISRAVFLLATRSPTI